MGFSGLAVVLSTSYRQSSYMYVVAASIGDGGLATSARLSGPSGIISDNAGGFLVADRYSQ